MIEAISAAVIPLILLLSAVPMLSRRRDYFSVFINGAREGLEVAIRLLPTMIALTAALSMVQASGALDLLTEILRAPAAVLGIPAEILPLAAARPLSGSASTAEFVRLMDACGADSLPALCASVMMGSSDTLIYILSVYFSGTAITPGGGVRKTRHAFCVAILVMLICIFLSCAVTRLFFSP